jgi:predicted secreted Zn-dependent protease
MEHCGGDLPIVMPPGTANLAPLVRSMPSRYASGFRAHFVIHHNRITKMISVDQVAYFSGSAMKLSWQPCEQK